MYAQRDDIGAVGVKLYYPDGTIQHAGVIYGILESAVHHLRYFSKQASGYANSLFTLQNISCVTGACIMTSKKKYLEVNGLDEQFKIAFNDVDYCLKLRYKGYLVIFNPFVECIHNEQTTRGTDDTKEKVKLFLKEKTLFLSKWKNYKEIYYNDNFTLNDWDFSMKSEFDNSYINLKKSWSYRIGRSITLPISNLIDFFASFRKSKNISNSSSI